MNLDSFLTFAKHYALGLVASCWNAGIRAVKLAGGLTTVSAIAPATLPTPNLKLLGSVFVVAIFWEAIDYFSDNPLPILKAPPAQPPAA